MSRRSRPRPHLLITILAIVLIFPIASPSVIPPAIGEADPSVIDPMLDERLSDTPDGQRLEVLVRFSDDIDRADRKVLDDLGIVTVGEFRIVPAAHIKATPEQIVRLSGYPGVEWMEWDAPLDYLMDMTTGVINATDTWRSFIEGSLWGDAGIDGSGVTAVVLDTGIDAGHPDLDYGTKTIRNLKSDTGTGPFYEIENGDTSSGHGTHCAGTVAGNGDASAGQKAGVAPGANLIGLSTGEAGAITGATGALQWVYEHTQPGNNPYNIRVVSNSWGAGGGIYEPGDTISEAINKLVYENNVVCVFAAGNSDGDGNTIQSGNYANTPAAINVAASGRDGSYITDFSSKGRWDWTDTYPDVAAPGHHIDSTAARRTQISAMTQQGDSNPYYLSISGTSMATPHVSGAVALLWQAAPSMRVSDVRQDAGVVRSDGGVYTVIGPDELEDSDERYSEVYAEWNDRLDTRIHEAELILKITADMIPYGDSPDPAANNLTDNAIPDWTVPGYVNEHPHDWSQGYGLINVERAVGLALTLEKIRWDYPEATVYDAFSVFENIFEEKAIVRPTDQLRSSWSGEWARFNEQSTNPINAVFEANQTRMVYIPAGAEQVRVSLSWPAVDNILRIVGTLGFQIDFDGNGGWDYSSSISPDLDGTRSETIATSGNDGQYWTFGIEGHGVKWHRIFEQQQFKEARIEYEMSVSITFGQGFGTIEVPPLSKGAVVVNLKFTQPTGDYTMGNISIVKPVYNLNNITWQPEVETPPFPDEGSFSFSWWWIIFLLLIILVVAFIIAKQQPDSAAGKRIRHVAFAVKADKVLDKTKGIIRNVKGKVIKDKKGVIETKEAKPETPEKAKKSGAKKSGAKKSGAKKPGAKKSGAKKSGAKKPGAKKPGAKKSGAKKSGAKKSGAKKPGAKKSGAKKSGAKKSGAKSVEAEVVKEDPTTSDG